ncbi:prolyl oligopeptidase family serine peptidase [Streptomyces sp. NPDC057137]|uniref:prolyl oligopeptidase family serine peptidase n=1 Tax=Streptomyces sp. NPDC057137 TaxID=3346030 RepID=UPI003635464A
MTHSPRPAFSAAPEGAPGTMPEIVLARSVAPSDNSTSVVLPAAAGPQIRTGAVGVTTHADIVYATREDADGQDLPLRLDLLVPQTPGPKPLVVYLPGGGFVLARKEAAPERRTYVAEAGYAVASAEYRTVLNGATYRDAVADAKSAIRFLRAHGARYGLDTSKVAVWGESAGGYLASLVGTTRAVAGFETPNTPGPPDTPGFSGDVQAVINQFGLSDLLKFVADFDPEARQALLRPGTPAAAFVFGPATGLSLADDSEAVAAADPTRYVTARTPPFLHFHGSADNVVPPSQSLLLHTALLEHGVESTRYVLTGARHGDLSAMLGDPEAALPWSTEEVLGHITGFLAKHLGS